MQIEADEIIAYMGTLYGAALHDLETANPSDVGLNGVSIVEWRKAYLEGIKDTVGGIVTRVPDEKRGEVAIAIRTACDKELETLRASQPAQQ